MSNVVQGPTKYTCNSCGNIFEGKWYAGVLDILRRSKFLIYSKEKRRMQIYRKVRGVKCPKCKSKDIYVLPVRY